MSERTTRLDAVLTEVEAVFNDISDGADDLLLSEARELYHRAVEIEAWLTGLRSLLVTERTVAEEANQ